MNEPHYDTPESIFNIPENLSDLALQDVINHTLSRVRGAIYTVSAAVNSKDEALPECSIPDCLYMVDGQLEQLEQLIKHKFEYKYEGDNKS